VIGNPEDLRRIQRDDLYRHYRSYYHPANAIVASPAISIPVRCSTA
jgi:predicted Zn-dependent peptidase